MSSTKAGRETYVALLRGINVGGKNKLAMSALSALFVEAGCDDVKTYIQSGNVVCRATPRVGATLARAVEAQIARSAKLSVPVVLRTGAELARTLERNPYLAPGADVERLGVMFLADEPGAEAASRLDPKRSPPDEFTLVGREIYLRCPEGFGRSKLTNAYFDAKLATVSTMRNWRTVQTLALMAAEIAAK